MNDDKGEGRMLAALAVSTALWGTLYVIAVVTMR